MKKTIFVLLILLPALMLSGCAPVVKEEEIPKTYSVYASFLPVFLLADPIIGENIPNMNLHLLIQPQDGCMRSYELSDWDNYIAANADALILFGNGFETFESAVMSYTDGGPAVISAISSLVLDSFGEPDNTESHLSGANPWMFLSVDGAIQITEAICANMIQLDPDYEEEYLDNLDKAVQKLEALKSDMKSALDGKNLSKPVALAHEGLGYLAREMGLNVAAYLDREPGAYPDDSERAKMLDILSASGAKAVLLEKQAPKSLVNALESAGYEIALIDTLSTGTASRGDSAYFERMYENAMAISELLTE